ncbi:MAG TPA: hypothetical protein VGG89_05360 [Candidatus Baltobacteraceae bacterium]|jgi:hypothetical protein
MHGRLFILVSAGALAIAAGCSGYSSPLTPSIAGDSSYAQPNGLSGTNVIKNGSFSQKLKFWVSCGSLKVKVSSQHPHSKKFAALTGSPTATSGWKHGLSAICQQVTVPVGGVLSAYLYGRTNVKSVKTGYMEVGIAAALSKTGSPNVTVLAKQALNNKTWSPFNWDLSKYAGQKLYVLFGVDRRGASTAKQYASLFIDDVALAASSTTPSPSPSPSRTPGALSVTVTCNQAGDVCSDGSESTNGVAQLYAIGDTASLVPSESHPSPFTLLSDTCNKTDDSSAAGNWATFSPGLGKSGSAFTVTAQNAGTSTHPATCHAVISDAIDQKVTIDIAVTTDGVGINLKTHKQRRP